MVDYKLTSNLANKVSKTGDTLSGNLTIRYSNTSQPQYRMINSMRDGFLQISSYGTLGLYDNTNSKWIISNNTNGEVSTPGNFYADGSFYENGTLLANKYSSITHNHHSFFRCLITNDVKMTSNNETVIPFLGEYYTNTHLIQNSNGTITWNGDSCMILLCLSLYFYEGTINNTKTVYVYRNDAQVRRTLVYPNNNYQTIEVTPFIIGMNKGDTIKVTYTGATNDIIGHDSNASTMSILVLNY